MIKQIQPQKVIIASICLLLLSCSMKVPKSKNSANGIVAIPLQIENTSTNVQLINNYKIFNSNDPSSFIIISPNTDEQDFSFSQELPPNKYYFDTFIRRVRSDKMTSRSIPKPQKMEKPIIVAVKPRTITIADVKMLIKQISLQKHYSYRTYTKFVKINDTEIENYAYKLKTLENSDAWQIYTNKIDTSEIVGSITLNNAPRNNDAAIIEFSKKQYNDLIGLGVPANSARPFVDCYQTEMTNLMENPSNDKFSVQKNESSDYLNYILKKTADNCNLSQLMKNLYLAKVLDEQFFKKIYRENTVKDKELPTNTEKKFLDCAKNEAIKFMNNKPVKEFDPYGEGFKTIVDQLSEHLKSSCQKYY